MTFKKRVAYITIFIFFLSGIFASFLVFNANDTEINRIELVIGIASIVSTMSMSILVYIQTMAINLLSASQFDVFIGTKSIGGSGDIPSEIFSSESSHESSSGKIFLTNKMCSPFFFVVFETQKGVENSAGKDDLYIPIISSIMSNVWIISTAIKSIDVIIVPPHTGNKGKNEKPVRIKTKQSSDPYCQMIKESELTLLMNVRGIDVKKVASLEVSVNYTITDQVGRTQQLVINSIIDNTNHGLVLVESKTKATDITFRK